MNELNYSGSRNKCLRDLCFLLWCQHPLRFDIFYLDFFFLHEFNIVLIIVSLFVVGINFNIVNNHALHVLIVLSPETDYSCNLTLLHWHLWFILGATFTTELLSSSSVRFDLNLIHPSASPERNLGDVFAFFELEGDPLTLIWWVLFLHCLPIHFITIGQLIEYMDAINIIIGRDHNLDFFDPRHLSEFG